MKIHVMRTKMTVDVVVNPSSTDSLLNAADVLTGIDAYVADLRYVALKIAESRLTRIDGPQSEAVEPVDDGLGDIPEHMRRTKKPEPAAAE